MTSTASTPAAIASTVLWQTMKSYFSSLKLRCSVTVSGLFKSPFLAHKMINAHVPLFSVPVTRPNDFLPSPDDLPRKFTAFPVRLIPPYTLVPSELRRNCVPRLSCLHHLLSPHLRHRILKVPIVHIPNILIGSLS